MGITVQRRGFDSTKRLSLSFSIIGVTAINYFSETGLDNYAPVSGGAIAWRWGGELGHFRLFRPFTPLHSNLHAPQFTNFANITPPHKLLTRP